MTSWLALAWCLSASMCLALALVYLVVRAAKLSKQVQVREATAREGERRMSLAIHAANQGLWVWDIAQDRVWVSENGRALFGWGSSEPIDLERFIATLHPDDRERVRRSVQRSLKGQGTDEMEFRVVLPDGRTRWIAGRGQVEFNGNGKPVRMRGVSLDVTERKVAEEALRESETRFRTMANTAPVMIWMSGTDKLCTFFNSGWLDFTGRTMEQELGNGWADGVHPADLDRCLEIYVRSFDGRLPFTMEYRLRRSDGEYRWVLDNGVPRYAPDGAFLGYIGSAIDVTERRQAELDATRQRNELAHLSRVAMLGELSGAMAHELNQPLTAILSNAQAAQRLLACDPPDLQEVRDILDDIVADDRRAGEVIRRLRLLLTKGEVQSQPLDVNGLVQDVLQLVNSDLLLHAVTAHAELAPDVAAVAGDRVQIQQVLLNLIMNACAAMSDPGPRGRILIVRTEPADGDGVRVSVIDRGRGISPEDMDRIFEPFFTTQPHGMGLGLAVCRTIIDAHGGRLWATNNDDGGAGFHFSLPLPHVAGSSATSER